MLCFQSWHVSTSVKQTAVIRIKHVVVQLLYSLYSFLQAASDMHHQLHDPSSEISEQRVGANSDISDSTSTICYKHHLSHLTLLEGKTPGQQYQSDLFVWTY